MPAGDRPRERKHWACGRERTNQSLQPMAEVLSDRRWRGELRCACPRGTRAKASLSRGERERTCQPRCAARTHLSLRGWGDRAEVETTSVMQPWSRRSPSTPFRPLRPGLAHASPGWPLPSDRRDERDPPAICRNQSLLSILGPLPHYQSLMRWWLYSCFSESWRAWKALFAS